MPSVQGADLKAVPADFGVGDFSDPQVPRGPWCAWHGYYGECPECKGREDKWTFTVVQADGHALVIDESRVVPGPAKTAVGAAAHGDRQERDFDGAPAPATLGHVPIRVNPGLLARIRLLLDERRAD